MGTATIVKSHCAPTGIASIAKESFKVSYYRFDGGCAPRDVATLVQSHPF